MNEIEQYEFDRQGFIVIRDMLTSAEVGGLRDAVDSLEEHALAHVDEPPRKKSPRPRGPEYHFDPEKGYHARGKNGEGDTLMIEDFWNADEAFDVLVNHRRTMEYVSTVVQERPTINNSEIRIRYRGNFTRCHGGARVHNQKYRYTVTAAGITCMMVRMVYFVHDVNQEQGAFCVVPSTHKINLPVPYDSDPDEDPDMIGLEVKSGDAIFFTEHLRHGGLKNRSDQVRKTIHVGFGPYWMMSQNIATMDDPQYVTPATLARYDLEQRNLFRAHPETEE